MAWSYDPTHPEDRDKVRLLIGDTNAADQQLLDEEIDLFLETEPDYPHAAQAALRVLVARYSRYTDKWVGDLKINASQRVDNYKNLLSDIVEAFATTLSAGVPSAGGIYASEKESAAADSALVQPYFRRGMLDNEDIGD